MTCPHFVGKETTGITALCFGAFLPFKPSSTEQDDLCTSGLHRACPLYRSAGSDLRLAIHREVARAIG
nr:hypothetical protein [Nitrospirota bacterium]